MMGTMLPTKGTFQMENVHYPMKTAYNSTNLCMSTIFRKDKNSQMMLGIKSKTLREISRF